MNSHDIDYKVFGKIAQYVLIALDPGETVIAEAGAMICMDGGVSYKIKMSDGSNPNKSIAGKFFSGIKRKISGENFFLTHFTNTSNQVKTITFAGDLPGSVLGVDLKKIGGSITCQKDAFLCAAHGTKIDFVVNRRMGVGFFAKEGFILQKVTGDGKFIMNFGGQVIQKKLKNETIKVDTGSLVAFTSGIKFDITLSGGLGTMMFGGEGVFLTELSGTGTVLLQSTPISKMANVLLGHSNFSKKHKLSKK
ncbi:MAG: hypothetical protein ACJAS6_000893 [Rickettsiales bacterium]|jgi:uncharacterized protein (TIGR00266 family)